MSCTTTLSFHLFSVPVVQKTVGQYAKHIVYYSETKDSSIPTEDIGVPNTESGRSENLEEGSRDLKQRQVRLSPFLYALTLPKLYCQVSLLLQSRFTRKCGQNHCPRMQKPVDVRRVSRIARRVSFRNKYQNGLKHTQSYIKEMKKDIFTDKSLLYLFLRQRLIVS